MQGEKFTLMQYNVNAILGFIEAGQFVIPEIQRPFVWKRAQVRDLIDSLYNGYPTGYILSVPHGTSPRYSRNKRPRR